MPALVRKVLIFAAVDGLILQPANQRSQRTIPSLEIRYTKHGTAILRPAPQSDLARTASLEAHGIHPLKGLLNIASASYLISILRREQVAQIRGFPVYVITSVALIPLSSQSEAEKAIERTKKEVQRESGDQDVERLHEGDSSADEGGYHSDGNITDDVPKESNTLIPPYGSSRRQSQEESDSVAQDVISRRGQYGRFAERWFSRKGWTSERRRAQGMSADDIGESKTISVKEQSNSGQSGSENSAPSVEKDKSDRTQSLQSTEDVQRNASKANDVTSTLLPKLLRTTKMLFASRSFFYSYDHDITRRLGDQKLSSPEVPFHRNVDPLYFWNCHLAQPFIDNGDHAYVLPLMQGFVGQRNFSINPKPTKDSPQEASEADQDIENVVTTENSPESASDFLLTLISRRSIMRPGLRYLRRGIDDEGHAANSVETEQILSKPSWNSKEKIYSFTQYRGSIPLFFSQSPYAFKPVPVLQHSFETNHSAFKQHFSSLAARYEDVQIALLVDKHGGEAEIGQQYEEHAKRLNAEDGIDGMKPGFEWFDFHAVCRGMRFENVSLLIDTLGDTLEKFGTTVEVNGEIQKRQNGILRTNCMDCLDRTNVVQSACGSRALEQQLKEEGLEVNLQTDATTQWFNALWADNGDAISKQYSSTAALKGDYTRTRKRDYRGALNDLGLTLSRYYNNIVNDYFSQAAIDFLLGNVTEQVFEEFEADMMSHDPAISMQKVRANAIETSEKIVVADQSEELVGGWTLLSPHEANTLRTFPFEEVVLLLTDAALYVVRFDWTSEKVKSFERVDLRSVTGIVKGTYITSTFTAGQMDEDRNVGLVIKYRPGKEDVARVNTRSLQNAAVGGTDHTSGDPETTRAAAIANIFNPLESGLWSRNTKQTSTLKLLALKALPAKSSSFTNTPRHRKGSEDAAAAVISERQLVSAICDDIRRAAYGEDGARGSDTGLSGDFVEEREIIGVKEARRSVGYLEQWGHGLKRLVWA
ncbi:MAG: hypothetical protein Q9222_001031 [Ikaeria aurantiellina]